MLCGTLSLIKTMTLMPNKNLQSSPVYLKDTQHQKKYISINDGKISHCKDLTNATVFIMETKLDQITPTAIGHQGLAHALKYQNKYLNLSSQNSLTLTDEKSLWKGLDRNSPILPLFSDESKFPAIKKMRNRLTQGSYTLEYEPKI